MVNVTQSTKSKKPSKKENSKKNNAKTEQKNLTHVYMHDKYFEEIGKIPISAALTTLYLHNNIITKIENLDGAVNLTNLYLQKNKIKKIENLNKLVSLRKLYLGHNEITVVENLDLLRNLEELHIEKQIMAKSDSLCFEPRTMFNIGKSLQILNISHNNITDLDGISPLRYLKNLDASYNNIRETKTICNVLQNMYYLHEATFAGNPVVKIHLYREDIIGNTSRLACLDGKNINETQRCFIKRFDHEKNNFASRQSLNIADQVPGLPKNYPPALQKAVSASILKTALTRDSFDSSADVTTYIPWKSLPRTSVDTTNRIPPLLRKQKKRTERPPVLSAHFLNFNT